MINFYCQCGQPMSVKDEFAGRAGNCPRCKQPFTVPPQSNLERPQPQSRGAPAHTQAYRASHRQPSSPPPPPPSVGGGAQLQVVHGPASLKGMTFTLQTGRPTVLGRDPGADLSIPSDRISRRHCQFVPSRDGGYVLEDLGSSNGTLVNQVRIQGQQVLVGGEYIQTGDCLFRYSP